MPLVHVLNSEAGEAKRLIEQLCASGYTIARRDIGSVRSLRQSPPHALVIDLARLRPASGDVDTLAGVHPKHSHCVRGW